MRKLQFFISIGLILSGISAQAQCDRVARLSEFYLDIPADFSGKFTKTLWDKKEVIVTGKSCEGPFHILVSDSSGAVISEKDYLRTGLYSDTMYIENAAPPYNLEMIVDTVYGTIQQ